MKKLKVLLLLTGLIGTLSIFAGCGSKTASGDDANDLGMTKEEMDEMRDAVNDDDSDDVSDENTSAVKTETINLTFSDGHEISFESPEATSVTQDGKTATVIYENGDQYYKATYSEIDIKAAESDERAQAAEDYYLERGITGRTGSMTNRSSIRLNDYGQTAYVGENRIPDSPESELVHYYILNDVGSENFLEIAIEAKTNTVYDLNKASERFRINRDGELN